MIQKWYLPSTMPVLCERTQTLIKLMPSQLTNILITIVAAFNSNLGKQGLSSLSSFKNSELTLSKLNFLHSKPPSSMTCSYQVLKVVQEIICILVNVSGSIFVHIGQYIK